MERGVDPKGLTLVAFGGAAGLHACALADALGCADVVFPAFWCALGRWHSKCGTGRTRHADNFGRLHVVDISPVLSLVRGPVGGTGIGSVS